MIDRRLDLPYLTREEQSSILGLDHGGYFRSQFMHNFDPTNNISWQLGHRGRVAVFIDGNNLFHAARFHNIDIDYNKLLRVLLGDGRLLRAFFYTGVDVGDARAVEVELELDTGLGRRAAHRGRALTCTHDALLSGAD